MLTECAELEAFRLARNWTWLELSERMAEYGIDVSPRTLHYVINRRSARPLDRTLHKIRQFLKATAEDREACGADAASVLHNTKRRRAPRRRAVLA